MLVWAPLMLILVALCSLRLGAAVKKRTGKGIFRQAGEQLALLATASIPPPWYYMFEFHDDRKRSRALSYIYRFEIKGGVYQVLAESLSPADVVEALRSKEEFPLRCQAHGIPAVPTIATAKRGTFLRSDAGERALPHVDLFLKPMRGSGGKGASRWRFQKDGSYEGNSGEVLSEMELIERLEQLSRRRDFIVRPLVTNHPALSDLSHDGVLNTVRVLTCVSEVGSIEVTNAVFKMHCREGTLVDNAHAGNIAAKVDLESGVLGRATDLGLSRHSGWWDRHPLTDAPITGRMIPGWDGVLDIARRAHAVFPGHVAIGWDIAVSGVGPLLVEGNKGPGLDVVQRTHGEGLGNSRFGHHLAFRLRMVQHAA